MSGPCLGEEISIIELLEDLIIGHSEGPVAYAAMAAKLEIERQALEITRLKEELARSPALRTIAGGLSG